MNNSIFQYAIGNLLDGRYFYIPAYQRGYRWTEKQVADLLHDLLCFANDPKQDGDFYCLQPVVARPITDPGRLEKIFGQENMVDVVQHGAWEIIDGQQRLTTIFLIYKYLVDQKGWSPEELMEEEGKRLYHLYYETRKDSTRFLESMTLRQNDTECIENANVDYFHMSCAFEKIDKWIKNEGKAINKRYKKGESAGKARDALFSLLNGTQETVDGSVQVLWYELSETNGTNAIREFQKINTGKIRLTDAELIKGLFLLKRNFDTGSQYIQQSKLAIEWEFIENTLRADNFWYFLQKTNTDLPNRIDFLFTLIYKIDKLKDLPEDEWSGRLEEIDTILEDPRQSAIFRFYNEKFEGLTGTELQEAVTVAWEEVMTIFRMLDDWFNTPQFYNYIGLLSQCGEDLSRLVVHFNAMSENASREDFKQYLVERIRYHLRGIKVSWEDKKIGTTYKDRKNIYRLLLTLNIHLLNEQDQHLKDSIRDQKDRESGLDRDLEIYKFPFDALNAQKWDIEHIDSFHTNALKRDEDKCEWIRTAREDLNSELNDEDRQKIDKWMMEKKYDEAIDFLKHHAKEDADDDLKNSIGNLTLLDAKTNRSYGNRLFCAKRRFIIDNITNGVFVPVATQYVFAKFFDEKGTNRSYWTQEDMAKYHDYIYEKLNIYLKDNK